MTVADVIEDAKYGELSQLGVVKKLEKTATKADGEKQILSYINLGLIEIYKRFSMRTEETVITMVEGQSLYTIDIANIYHDPDNLDGYLNALPGELNAVLGAYDEEGEAYPLNDETDDLSVNTPSYNVIQVPNPVAGEGVFIIYNSAPDRLIWQEDLSLVTLPIAPALLEALLHYIGYRGHGSVDGSIQAENNTHYMRFDASCKRVEALGLNTLDAILGNNVQEKGFV